MRVLRHHLVYEILPIGNLVDRPLPHKRAA